MRLAVISVAIVYYIFYRELDLYKFVKLDENLSSDYNFLFFGYIILFIYAVLSLLSDLINYFKD